jgi:type II secretory pathway pseudopilin PulG
LVELLAVMAIISILVALVLAAAQGVMAKAARNRAGTEIEGMKNALESYKLDNGTYPSGGAYLTAVGGAYSTDPTGVGTYIASSQLLYQALSGKTNYTDVPVAGVKAYMLFKTTQLGNYKTTSVAPTYVQDPWNYSYGYSTGDANTPQTDPPENGTGFFDLWSTGGSVSTSTVTTNAWITNWRS